MRAYNFGEAGRQIQDFLWSEFADWYVEVAKVQLEGDAPATTRAVLYGVLEGALRLLHWDVRLARLAHGVGLLTMVAMLTWAALELHRQYRDASPTAES